MTCAEKGKDKGWQIQRSIVITKKQVFELDVEKVQRMKECKMNNLITKLEPVFLFFFTKVRIFLVLNKV